jgi:hypothetical protein
MTIKLELHRIFQIFPIVKQTLGRCYKERLNFENTLYTLGKFGFLQIRLKNYETYSQKHQVKV